MEMTTRYMKYNKNGFDIKAVVNGSGEGAVADILYRPFGENVYMHIGKIYQIYTAACGTTRDTLTWSEREVATVINKKSWHEAAKDLYRSIKKGNGNGN
jgi:hypothetical protein